MDVRTQETVIEAEALGAAQSDERVVETDEVIRPITPPGLHDSVVLAMDYVLTLGRLFKAESSLALSALPVYLALNITRLPVYLLTWISFAALIATAVYSFTGSPLLTATTFFALQLALTFILERHLRKAGESITLPETRRSVAAGIASVKERFNDEQKHS